MMINQTGHAMQPGPRNYNAPPPRRRRDRVDPGAHGQAKVARDYLRWYTDHALNPNGMISPILNEDGSINRGFGSDIEYDSQGQYIMLVADIARLDGGPQTVREYLPAVKQAMKFMQELRERTMAPGYMAGESVATLPRHHRAVDQPRRLFQPDPQLLGRLLLDQGLVRRRMAGGIAGRRRDRPMGARTGCGAT